MAITDRYKFLVERVRNGLNLNTAIKVTNAKSIMNLKMGFESEKRFSF
jgi:hypothetical protein